ncbi:AEC family transporter [Nesterenkonia jeotgali]|uniref:Putative permease n=1 Tax=Nesterenkonia jeotgali TaxID=317018 RepID=A0A839FYG2_9MICC|nr:AEC family transporter [Nesterenkonia jeotgali]MBA8921777.1 putative permease [Nesterenkonia jeotgali]
MGAVLSGFTIIWLIIAVGWIIGRFGVLGPDARVALSRVAFFVASPCLLFVTISESSLRAVLGPQFLIATLGALSTLLAFVLIGRFLLLKSRPGSDLMIGGMSGSLVNGANLGFPIAAYVLGDVALAAPIIMFQLAIYTPIYVTALDLLTRDQGSMPKVRPHPRISVLRSLGQSAVNPMIIGATLGLLFSWQQLSFPTPVQEAIELLAGASIPLMLLAFGLSLVGSRPLDKATGRRRDVFLAAGLKLILHPVLAWLLAAVVFGLDDHQVLVAVVMAALPTAQNVLVTAVRYQAGEVIARDTVLLTTIAAIPTVVLVAALLG